ncbi:MAG: hypothetical protein ING19_00495 [Azospirillum sp.]|nr:hypothetical protein [Azospirillum sp.]
MQPHEQNPELFSLPSFSAYGGRSGIVEFRLRDDKNKNEPGFSLIEAVSICFDRVLYLNRVAPCPDMMNGLSYLERAIRLLDPEIRFDDRVAPFAKSDLAELSAWDHQKEPIPLSVRGRDIDGVKALYPGHAYAKGKEDIRFLRRSTADAAYGVEFSGTNAESLLCALAFASTRRAIGADRLGNQQSAMQFQAIAECLREAIFALETKAWKRQTEEKIRRGELPYSAIRFRSPPFSIRHIETFAFGEDGHLALDEKGAAFPNPNLKDIDFYLDAETKIAKKHAIAVVDMIYEGPPFHMERRLDLSFDIDDVGAVDLIDEKILSRAMP